LRLFILAYNFDVIGAGFRLNRASIGVIHKNKMRTINRPTPEGAWDHEIPVHLADSPNISTDDFTTKPTPLLALGLLHHTKENLQMLKGWRTVGVAVAIAAVGALQTSGLADIIPAPYVGPAMMALGFAMAWLRSMTDTKVGVK
jgi:hypothetical protein